MDPPLMMAQSRVESTCDIYNYGKYINQFPPNTIKAIRQYERINKKICRQKMFIMFNEICINILYILYIWALKAGKMHEDVLKATIAQRH